MHPDLAAKKESIRDWVAWCADGIPVVFIDEADRGLVRHDQYSAWVEMRLRDIRMVGVDEVRQIDNVDDAGSIDVDNPRAELVVAQRLLSFDVRVRSRSQSPRSSGWFAASRMQTRMNFRTGRDRYLSGVGVGMAGIPVVMNQPNTARVNGIDESVHDGRVEDLAIMELQLTTALCERDAQAVGSWIQSVEITGTLDGSLEDAPQVATFTVDGNSPLSPDVAFPGLFVGWVGSAGKTLGAGSDVATWAPTLGSGLAGFPALVPGVGAPQSAADHVALSHAGAGCSLQLAAPAAMGVDDSDDRYLALCVRTPEATEALRAVLGESAMPYHASGFLASQADGFAGGTSDGASSTGSDPYIDKDREAVGAFVAQQVDVWEFWSAGDAHFIRYRGGAAVEVKWDTAKWASTWTQILLSCTGAGGEARVYELHVSRGAYPGDVNCARWRAHCEQYGYAGN